MTWHDQWLIEGTADKLKGNFGVLLGAAEREERHREDTGALYKGVLYKGVLYKGISYCSKSFCKERFSNAGFLCETPPRS